MTINNISPVGVSPKPPDFKLQAQSYNLLYYLVENKHNLIKILNIAFEKTMSAIVEISEITY